MKHLINLNNWTGKEISRVISKAMEMKSIPEHTRSLANKIMVMLFEKSSTRTRLSFEAGMTQLGGHAIFLDKRTTQFGIAEYIDEIRATMRFGDILMYRPLKNQSLVDAEKVSKIPIINGCCERYHPCQGISDAMTMVEMLGGLKEFKNKKVVWLGVGNNVSNSLINACTKLGAKVTLCIAEKDPVSIDNMLEENAKRTGLYEETNDLSCLKDADFVHTDTWLNMEFFDQNGKVKDEFKKEFGRRKKAFMPFQLSKKTLEKHRSSAKIMHCMPCHVGYEITRDAIDHPNSIIFDQAENRTHAQKAILLKLLGKI